MTVKECRAILTGPTDVISVGVEYEGDHYDITAHSPVSEAFADYIVDGVTAPKPFEYVIFLKQVYVKKEGTV